MAVYDVVMVADDVIEVVVDDDGAKVDIVTVEEIETRDEVSEDDA